MKLHASLTRTLPAHLRGMLVAAHRALAMSGCADAPKNPVDARIEAGQYWFGSAALVGSGGR